MWDCEVDVVVIGYGGAGAAAAIAANNEGARVLILEKQASGGGNTKYANSGIRTFLNSDKAVDYIDRLCEGTTDRDVLKAFVAESGRNADWITNLGGTVLSRPS